MTRGGDQRTGVAFEQCSAGGMVDVVSVRGGDERPGVDDQHAEARPKPSANSSSARAAPREDRDEPTAAKGRRRRRGENFS